LAYRPADDSEIGNASVDAAALLAEMAALRQRLAALEARLPPSAVADPPERRQALTQPQPRSKIDPAALEPDAAGRIARRRALGLGALASLFAFIGHSAARAADALTIDPNGDVNIGKLSVENSLSVAGRVQIGEVLYVPGNTNPKVTSQGAYLGWNASGGVGETDFINNRGLGSGGFAFVNTPPSGDPRATLMTISGDGNVEVAGNLVGKGDATLQKTLTITGNQAVQESAGKNTVDIQRAARPTHDHPTGLALYVTAESSPEGGGVEFRHSNTTQGIGFGYNTIYATGTWTDQPLILKARGTGTVQIGAQKQGQSNLHVPGGAEPLRMLRGIINSDGNKYAGGDGFTVTRVPGRGLYDIVFTPGFPSVPVASVTQIYGRLEYGNATATSEGGQTTDNAVIAVLAADRMRVKTGKSNGDEDPRFFSLIVIGPR
jgi:hypothetical protein